VWFAQPAKALADPVRLLAYVTTLGRGEDIQTLRRHLGDDDLREAPECRGPASSMAPGSCWHLILDR
jgi:hypothetical protein